MANKNTKELINSVVIAMSVVIMAVISALIIGSLTSSNVFADIPNSGSVTNETEAYINSTGYTLALASADSFANPIITAVYNASDDALILAGNYTVSGIGVVTNVTTTTWDNVSISYTYDYASGTSLAGVNVTNISDNFGLFVTNLIAFLAIMGTILGVVWLVIYVRKLFDKKEGLQGITA